MTDTEFENAKGIVFDNIVRLTNPLRRPSAYDEFLAAAAKVKQALPHLGWDVSAADFDKILRAVRAGLTVQMEDDEAVIEDAAAHKKWLAAVKSDIDWFFWTRYENYLRHDKNWSPTLTAALNVASDKILDLTGNLDGKFFSTRADYRRSAIGQDRQLYRSLRQGRRRRLQNYHRLDRYA